MNVELLEILNTHHANVLMAKNEDATEALTAKREGDWLRFFDLSLYFQLADLCWALEKWEDAKQLYVHNAKILVQKREWLSDNKPLNYPEDAILDLEAVTFIKAGQWQMGKEYLPRAVQYWKQKKGNELVLTSLGLHAAQIGIDEFVNEVENIIIAREQLVVKKSLVPDEIRKAFHYEFVETKLLTGKWDEFYHSLEIFEKAIQSYRSNTEILYNVNLDKALISACEGFRVLANIKKENVKVHANQESAKDLFEEAMLNFFKFSQQIDTDIYFMRMNCRIANQIAEGKPINPNPFMPFF